MITEGQSYISSHAGKWEFEGAPIPENFDSVNVDKNGVLMIGNASPLCSGMYTVKDGKKVDRFLISELCVCVDMCTLRAVERSPCD